MSNKGPHSFTFQFHNKKNIDLSKKNMKGKLLCFLIKKAEPALGLIVTNLLRKKYSLKWYFKALSWKRSLIVSEVKVNGNSYFLTVFDRKEPGQTQIFEITFR